MGFEAVLVVLEHIKAIVSALFEQKLVMASLLDDLAVAHYDDIVGVLYGGKAMRHHQHCTRLHHLRKRILNEKLGFGVDICRRFVKNHYLRLMDYRARKRQKLTLTGGEVVSALSYFLVKSVVEPVYEFIGVDVAAGFVYFLVAHAVHAKKDIAAYRSGEQEHILKHLPEAAAEGGKLYLSNVDAVKKYFALLYVIVTAEERQYRSLAGAGGADEGNIVARVDFEGDILQHPVFIGIRKPYMAELDAALYVGELDGVGSINDLRLHVKQRENLLCRSECRLEPVELLRKVLDRVEEFRNVHIKRHNGAACYGLTEEGCIADVASAAEIQQAHDGRNVEHIDRRAEDAEHEHLLFFRLAEPVVLFGEFVHLPVLAVEDLYDLHARKVFRKKGVDIGCAVLDLAVCLTREFPEDYGEQYDERHEAEHHKRQLVVQAEHCRKHAHDYEAVFYEVDDEVREHHGNCVCVVGEARHQLADGDGIELVMRKRFDMGEKILAESGDYLLPCFLEYYGLEIGADKRNDEYRRIYGYTNPEV